MALTCFAVQVITTPAYAYLSDCELYVYTSILKSLMVNESGYKPQSSECAQILNFIRQVRSASVRSERDLDSEIFYTRLDVSHDSRFLGIVSRCAK
jgi:hypothetical protein